MLGKRADGYHALDSLVAFLSLHDTLTLIPADRWSLHLTGPWSTGLETLGLESSTLGSALAGWQRYVGPLPVGPHTICIDKQIPHGGGLGGGSCDAGALLRWLAEQAGVCLTDPDLQAAALDLGADGPVCLHSQSAHVTGLGEVVRPLSLDRGQSLPAWSLLLIHPGVPVATGPVFKALGAHPIDGPGHATAPGLPRSLTAWLATRRNDLEPVACAQVPAVAAARQALADTVGDQAALIRMTGSGATLFALFSPGTDASPLAETLRAALPGAWVSLATVI